MFFLKGFIGPLGDDIPGVFPIVLGIVLFVSSLLYANGQVQNANNQMNLRSAGLSLAYVVSQNPYLTAGSFNLDCANAWQPLGKNLNLKFIIVVKSYCQYGLNFSLNPFISCQDPTLLASNSPSSPANYIGGSLNHNYLNYYTCWSNDTATSSILDNVTSYTYSNLINSLPSNAVILSFPIAVNCPTTSSLTTNYASSNSNNMCDYSYGGSMTYGVGTLNIMVWQ